MSPNMSKSALALLVAAALAGCKPAQQPEAQKPGAPPQTFITSADASASTGSSQAPSTALTTSSLPDFTSLMKAEGPAVVNVITTNKASRSRRGQGEEEDPMEEFFRRFMPDLPGGPGGPGGPGAPGGAEPRGGLGSGFIVSADGYILTNAHVVADFDDVTVRLSDAKREFKAKVIGADKRTDVALIKIEASGLPVAKLGNSAQLEAGQWVAAIGSPFGFSNTITAGIVSATGRALPEETYVPFIQTDVAVNPGNSGGPLINLKGEVVGINSQIYSRTGGYMGVSFAIPIEMALDVAKQLQAHGKVTRGRMGIGIQPVTKELAESFKLDSTTGAVVTAVERGSPAEKAGIKVGDVILQYNGKNIDDPNELPRLVAGTKPGERASIQLWRTGKREQVAVTVGEFPDETKTASREAPQKPSSSEDNGLGLAVAELPPEARKQLGIDYGLVVQDVVGGPAQRSRLQPGDVIVAVNQEHFRSIDEFNKLVARRRKGEKLALLVRRAEASVYVPIEAG
jgi:serine protease Do